MFVIDNKKKVFIIFNFISYRRSHTQWFFIRLAHISRLKAIPLRSSQIINKRSIYNQYIGLQQLYKIWSLFQVIASYLHTARGRESFASDGTGINMALSKGCKSWAFYKYQTCNKCKYWNINYVKGHVLNE